MADIWDGLIIGVGSGIIVTLFTSRFLERGPVGGGSPNQPLATSTYATGGGLPTGLLYVVDTPPNPSISSPLQQTVPITEAAWSSGPGPTFTAAFGSAVNRTGVQAGAQANVILPV